MIVRIFGREVGIRGVIEREGRARVLIVEMEREEDKEELIEKSVEVRRRWGVGVDEDLTMEEKKARWRIVEKTRTERAKGKEVIMTNRRLWVDRKELKWDEEREIRVEVREREEK